MLETIRNCPFLIQLHYAFHTPSKLYLVVDYAAGGDLATQLLRTGKFDVDRVRIYVAEIVLAIEQLHQHNILHRDLKMENVLLDADGHIIVTDFGLSTELVGDAKACGSYGTLESMAPEILVAQAPYDMAVDWWSLGVLTYELLTNMSPFNHKGSSTDAAVARRIQNSTPAMPSYLNETVRDFINALLIKNPRHRLNSNRHDAAEIRAHPFLADIDWTALAEKRVEAPFRPVIRDPLDTANFDGKLTRKKATDLPTSSPSNQRGVFDRYSFVAAELRVAVMPGP